VAQAQFTYTTNNGTVTITDYTGSGGNVTIPSTIDGLSVTSIDWGAFSGRTDLTNVTIPNSVTSIGVEAFYYCTSLMGVSIGTSLNSIGYDAFGYCTSLNAITVDVLNPSYSSVNGVLFNKTQTTLVRGPAGASAGTYVIPASVTTIGNEAFYGCTGLTNITIPDGVTTIGQGAFYGCIGLSTITIPQSVTEFGTGFDGTYTFAECLNLKSVFFQGNLPSNISYVGSLFDFGPVTVFYLPGTTGWAEFAITTGVTTALWTLPYPLILNNVPSFGVQSNAFGFTVSWATNLSVVIEASTDLSHPIWSPVTTNAVSGGTFYFTDPQWSNYPSRFYRIRSP
jgi:hypothetical protein